MIGRVLGGRYRLDSALGRGGMATVWAGRDTRLDRPVAVKLLDAKGAADSVAAERFRREAHAVARLSHPNIVAVHDFDVDGGTPYLVMELLTGRSVDDMLAAGPLPVAEAVTIATQAARAISAAHAAGVVHRDIKPANLLVDDSGNGSYSDDAVKVLDFGIAQLQHVEQPALTRTAMAMGTSHYMAPETARGERAGPKADLYGLGCTLYAMLTGAPPFEGSSPIAVLHKQVTEVPSPVSATRPDVPPALDALVAELLAKDPAKRPPNAAAVAARLAAMPTTELPTTANMATAPVPVYDTVMAPAVHMGHDDDRPAVRRYALPAAAAVVVMVLVVAGVLLWAGSDTPNAGGSPTAAPSTAAPAASSAAPSQPPATPAGRLALLRQLVNQQVDAGEINSDAGQQLNRKLDEIGKALRRDKNGDAAHRLSKLRDDLDEMREDGEVSDTGYAALTPALDSLAVLLPADDNKDDNGKGKDRKGNDDEDDS